ncbi:hypothetical protein JST99_00310 [Candidatus Dependentiae bacterium]|nr:hypothetical protein [Candidatus Dependentiae bacterium]
MKRNRLLIGLLSLAIAGMSVCQAYSATNINDEVRDLKAAIVDGAVVGATASLLKGSFCNSQAGRLLFPSLRQALPRDLKACGSKAALACAAVNAAGTLAISQQLIEYKKQKTWMERVENYHMRQDENAVEKMKLYLLGVVAVIGSVL